MIEYRPSICLEHLGVRFDVMNKGWFCKLGIAWGGMSITNLEITISHLWPFVFICRVGTNILNILLSFLDFLHFLLFLNKLMRSISVWVIKSTLSPASGLVDRQPCDF